MYTIFLYKKKNSAEMVIDYIRWHCPFKKGTENRAIDRLKNTATVLHFLGKSAIDDKGTINEKLFPDEFNVGESKDKLKFDIVYA